MGTVRACQEIRDRVSPFILAVKAVHIVVDKIQNHIDIIAAVEFAVHILHHKLGIGIASTASHTCHGGVYHYRAQPLCHLNKLLGQGKGHLQIIVGMKPDPGTRVKIVMDQVEYPLQILLVQGAESVHNGECIGFQFVYLFNQCQQLCISVTKDIYRLHI